MHALCHVIQKKREAKNWLLEEEWYALEGISDVSRALGINDGMDF